MDVIILIIVVIYEHILDIFQQESLKENPTYPLGIEELRLDLLPLDFIKATETEKLIMV